MEFYGIPQAVTFPRRAIFYCHPEEVRPARSAGRRRRIYLFRLQIKTSFALPGDTTECVDLSSESCAPRRTHLLRLMTKISTPITRKRTLESPTLRLC